MARFGLGVAVGTFAGAIVVLVIDEWLKTSWPGD